MLAVMTHVCGVCRQWECLMNSGFGIGSFLAEEIAIYSPSVLNPMSNKSLNGERKKRGKQKEFFRMKKKTIDVSPTDAWSAASSTMFARSRPRL